MNERTTLVKYEFVFLRNKYTFYYEFLDYLNQLDIKNIFFSCNFLFNQ
jgi:hypothetical protein